MTNYPLVLGANYVGTQWSISDNDYDTLVWNSSSTKPTKAKLDSEWAELQTAIAKAEADKATAKQAVLDKLGLTADEVTALLF